MKLLLAAALAMLPTAATAEVIVVCIVDDLGWGDLKRYPTPNFDSLQTSSVQLSRLYAAPTCVPSQKALWTGRRHEIAQGNYQITDSWASQFKAAGYTTAAIGKIHCPADGWDIYEDPKVGGDRSSFKSSRKAVNRAVELLEAAPEKFLLCVSLRLVHAPHGVPKKYKEQADGTEYGGCVAALNEQLGKLMGALPSTAVFWLFSDNGGNFPEANNGSLRGDKHTVYEGGVRVRSWIRFPGCDAGAKYGALMAVEDVGPTLAGLAGVPFGFAGLDFSARLPRLPGLLAIPGMEFIRLARQVMDPLRDHVLVGKGNKMAVISHDGYKLVRLGTAHELYDLVFDRRERLNLWNDPRHADAQARLLELLGE